MQTVIVVSFFSSPTPLQNKTFFHQFSLKENWLQHRGTMNEAEESKYDLRMGKSLAQYF